MTATAPVASATTFRKYHGLGNDFILIDNRLTSTPLLSSEQSVQLCDRHMGIGADGVIFLLPSDTDSSSHCSMRLYNSDGSEPEMCGNGIRCLAQFAYDLDMKFDQGMLRVNTKAGMIIPQIMDDGMVKVDMGRPVLEKDDIPTRLEDGKGWMNVDDRDWWMRCVSMGNPHAVCYLDESQQDDLFQQVDAKLEHIGPLFEHHPLFPERTNTEFVRVINPNHVQMTVWERGAGRTRACGTGACAVVVAGVLEGKLQRGQQVQVDLPGGPLIIVWEEEEKGGKVMMTGPAQFVFEGTVSSTLINASTN